MALDSEIEITWFRLEIAEFADSLAPHQLLCSGRLAIAQFADSVDLLLCVDREGKILGGNMGADRRKPSILRGLRRAWVTSVAASCCEKEARAEETSARMPHWYGMQESAAHVGKWHRKLYWHDSRAWKSWRFQGSMVDWRLCEWSGVKKHTILIYLTNIPYTYTILVYWIL